jgi:short-subunit dehydrogenase
LNFKDKTVVLTGASSGIGYHLAKLLIKEDSKLALLSRRKELIDELKNSFPGSSNKIFTYRCDVSNVEDVKKVFDEIKNTFGQIDVLILNAGVSGRTTLKNFSTGFANEIFGVNFFGIINCAEQVLKDFMDRREGMIVGVSSLADVKGFPKSGLYNASKSAVSRWLESIRVELKPYNVKVITVRPGFIRTPMTDKNEFHMPFLMDVEKAVNIILKGIKEEKRIIQFPFIYVAATKLLEILPSSVFEWFAGRPLPPRKDKANKQ